MHFTVYKTELHIFMGLGLFQERKIEFNDNIPINFQSW